MKNIAVFFGGESIEHEISVITGVLNLNGVDKQKFNPIPVFVNQNGEWWSGENLFDLDFYKNFDTKYLDRVTLVNGDNKLYKFKGKKLKPLMEIACAINCMHGERGEDGSLFGMLNMCKIPLCSPPLFSSATSMSKAFTKIVLKGIGVKTLPYFLADKKEDAELITQKFSFPLIVKPDSGGSSIGITTCNNKMQLQQGLLVAMRYSNRAIVEPKLDNFIEINCACYKANGKTFVSECEKPTSRGEILSFNDKYRSGEREFPAQIPKRVSDRIKKTTQKVYESLGFEGVIRIDYIIKDGELFLNEINSVPGSLAFYLFCDTVKGWSEVLSGLIEDAIVRHAKESTLTKKFNSGILTITGGKGSKRLKK